MSIAPTREPDEAEAPFDLRSKYQPPSQGVLRKQVSFLEKHAKAFIARSPFLVLASSGSGGRVDASPRGDMPGFVRVLDDHRLVIPDRPGNNRLDTFQNILIEPHVGMIFFVPGMNETLRVNGIAHLSFDDELLASLAVDGKSARSGLVVHADEVFFHCGKALIRSHLWDPEKHIDRSTLPSFGAMLTDIRGGTAEDVVAAERSIEQNYRDDLY